MAAPELLGVPVVAQIGGIAITRTVVTTWGIMGALAVFSAFATRRLALCPTALQAALEGVVGAVDDAIRAVLPEHAARLLPFIGTLWIYVVLANLVSVLPGLRSPTGDLSQTAALAVLVLLAVHGFGLRTQGLRAYLTHYLKPNPIFLPFHLLGELTRTVALTVRLAGNVMSLETAALLVLWVAGFLAPVPVLMLHIVEALVQAYIFGMLALLYLAGAIQAQELAITQRKD
jgi:F-type H+-transporting ATPase subunit a